jgi:hypothetical protein
MRTWANGSPEESLASGSRGTYLIRSYVGLTALFMLTWDLWSGRDGWCLREGQVYGRADQAAGAALGGVGAASLPTGWPPTFQHQRRRGELSLCCLADGEPAELF